MGPYHAMMSHFPVAVWVTASIIIVARALSDSPLARQLDRVLVPFLMLGLLTGVITYVLGLLVWPADTLQTTPLGRNHMMAATWSMFYWAAVMVLRWRVGERAWDGLLNRLIMLGLGALGGGLLAITGTLGGHLHGAPTFISSVLRLVGWEVYLTFYFPTWVMFMLAIVIIAMPVIAVVTARGRDRAAAAGEKTV
ncbi:MAG: DUF2231 domain-containing protein [Gammaproteobacteria bacterium]